MKLLPNLIGLWVYEDERAPVYDPPAMTLYQGRYYVHPSATDAFHRWVVAREQREWRYQDAPQHPCARRSGSS